MGLPGTMSAIGTALGPSLGGALIAGLNWHAVFLANVPLGITAVFLVQRYVPQDPRRQTSSAVTFDTMGTLLLASTLAAYALAMTWGRGSFGWLNFALPLAAGFGTVFFVIAERSAASPLINLTMFRDPVLSASLGLSACVSTVMMSTLVVGPFYLSRALGLDTAMVGLISSIGPLVVALSGVPAVRIADHYGAQRMTIAGLIAIAAGSLMLAVMPIASGIPGYVISIVVITVGYTMLQTANNTAVMKNVEPERRGVVSGMLNLSRNLGLITGASAMGAVFAVASGANDLATAQADNIATGMHVTFAVAASGIVIAVVGAFASRVLSARRALVADAT